MPPRRRGKPTFGEIMHTARVTAAALGDYGLDCGLFGSAACSIWKMTHRSPNDVDMIVFTTELHAEHIKELIIAVDDRFYLVPAKDPKKSYRVLYYALKSGRHCKVDILTPGILDIPDMPAHRILFLEAFPGIPVVPYVVLILLKLRGWTDDRDSSEARFRAKKSIDEADINELLSIMPGLSIYEEGWDLLDVERSDWMPEWFQSNGEARIAEFVEVYPDTAWYWREMGFRV